MADQLLWLIGIDWATSEHEACLMDRDRQACQYCTVRHTAEGLAAFVDWILQQAGGDPREIGVAIETPHGALVETLVERGFPVFAINPKQLDRFRDRHTAAGAKDDRRDALVLADSLRTDRPAFRRVRVDDPRIIHLRALSRLEDDLQADLSRVTNRIREQVYRVAPTLLTLCPAADEPWFWTLVELAPTPEQQHRLATRQIERLLVRHRIRRLNAPAVRNTLQQPAVRVARGVAEAVISQLRCTIPQARLLHEQRRDCAAQIERLLNALAADDAENPAEHPREHRDVTLLRSLPGVGQQITATMLAEASQPLNDRDCDTLRTYSGAAPVTKRSGRRQHVVIMRYACNPRLRDALYHWSLGSIKTDPASRAYYDMLRARGHHHGRALRSVGDRWLRILVAMLRDRTLYDPTRFSLRQVVAVA